MPHRVCVIDLPGLSRDLLAVVPPATALGKWLSGKPVVPLTPSFPAVTCSVQATLTTGVSPSRHGIIANGLPTFRFPQDQALIDADMFAAYRRQISFWEQSNQLLDAPRFWQDAARQSKWKTALLFFQQSMPGFGSPPGAGNALSPAGRPPGAADIVLTPKPDHGPDGKLTSLCWSEPAGIVPDLFKHLGPFPLLNYWGPMAGIAASKWIAAACARIWQQQAPQLEWAYVPHLDYDLQRFGPSSPQARQAVIDLAAALDPLIDAVISGGGKIVLLSEYAMSDVSVVVHPNRILAEAGLLSTRSAPDGRLIDYENSTAVAMVDHQVAHVYARNIAKTRDVLSGHSGFTISDRPISHRRCGDLVLSANPDTWFDYRWWRDGDQAPAFAKTVDIHRKPGYDALELFWDRAANGVSQNPSLLKGSHGLVTPGQAVLVAEAPPSSDPIHATDVAAILTEMLG